MLDLTVKTVKITVSPNNISTNDYLSVAMLATLSGEPAFAWRP